MGCHRLLQIRRLAEVKGSLDEETCMCTYLCKVREVSDGDLENNGAKVWESRGKPQS